RHTSTLEGMVKRSALRWFPQAKTYGLTSVSWYRALCVAVGVLSGAQAYTCHGSGDALADYVGLQDKSFDWKKTAEREIGGVTAVRVDCVSQTWRGHPWEHQLLIVRPPEVRNADIALLLVTGDGKVDDDFELLKMLATRAG